MSFEQRIINLERELQNLKRKDDNGVAREIEQLKRQLNQKNGDINRLISTIDKKIVEDAIDDKIIDIVWNKYFYFFSPFESEEGWDVVSEAASPVTGSGLTLETTNVADNRSLAFKGPTGNTSQSLTFDEPSRFRTIFQLGIDTAASDIDYSLSVGPGITTATSRHYGFRLEEDELYGICADGTTATKVKLIDIPADQGGGLELFPLTIEAIFEPGKRVDFYTTDFGDDELVQRGSLTSNVPQGRTAITFEFDLYTRTTTVKDAFVPFMEYIQRRPVK